MQKGDFLLREEVDGEDISLSSYSSSSDLTLKTRFVDKNSKPLGDNTKTMHARGDTDPITLGSFIVQNNAGAVAPINIAAGQMAPDGTISGGAGHGLRVGDTIILNDHDANAPPTGLTEAALSDGNSGTRSGGPLYYVKSVDPETGAFKRYWGAYGNRPSDDRVTYTPGEPLPQQFVGPVHCAEPSNDGLIYVCDRGADRIQVFRPDGTFVKEAQIAAETVGAGATWDIAFSQDDQQEFIYVADGSNMKVHVVDRDSLEVLYVLGEGGRQSGLFYGTHSIVTDSRGNFYTTETYEGKRIQKFQYRGLRPLDQIQSGPAWPEGSLIGE